MDCGSGQGTRLLTARLGADRPIHGPHPSVMRRGFYSDPGAVRKAGRLKGINDHRREVAKPSNEPQTRRW